MAFELPPLPYDYSALEPTIDAATMKLHHDMHHAAYVKNLNAALEKYPNLQSKSAEDLIRDLNALPEDIRGAVRNNGGGHVNHSMFWKIMKPKGGGDPSGPIAEAIQKSFGSFKDFQTKFNDAGVKQFGSGWAWLAGKKSGEVQILSTANQDNPISQGLFPIFGNDVWEHALRDRVVLIGSAENLHFAALLAGQPRPSATELLDSGVVELGLKILELPKDSGWLQQWGRWDRRRPWAS